MKIFYFIVKRLFDICCGILGILLIVPLYIFIRWSYILAKDYSGIIYTQDRIGKYGKIIKIYKFRTMVPNSEELLDEILKDDNYRKEWEEFHKIEDDPRITPLGKFLRKSSLDEIPQFLNVLKGDMSLIGPRPLVEGELEFHGGDSRIYNLVRPGITGWWACHGRSNLNYDERLEMEYYYVRNCSIKLDIICIYKTIVSVLEAKGAQ